MCQAGSNPALWVHNPSPYPLDHGGIAAQKSFNLDIHSDNPNNEWKLTKSESVLNPNQCLTLITIYSA